MGGWVRTAMCKCCRIHLQVFLHIVSFEGQHYPSFKAPGPRAHPKEMLPDLHLRPSRDARHQNKISTEILVKKWIRPCTGEIKRSQIPYWNCQSGESRLPKAESIHGMFAPSKCIHWSGRLSPLTTKQSMIHRPQNPSTALAVQDVACENGASKEKN